MTATETIRNTEIIERSDGSYTLSISLVGKHGGLDMFLMHSDVDVQKIGHYAMDELCAACGIQAPDDTSELHGKPFPRSVWINILDAAKRQREILAGPTVQQHAKPLTVASAPIPEALGDCRYVYVITCVDSEVPLCKIGIASHPESRLKQLSTASPHRLRIEATAFSPRAADIEAAAHLHFAGLRKNGEWFGMPASHAIKFVHDKIAESAA